MHFMSPVHGDNEAIDRDADLVTSSASVMILRVLRLLSSAWPTALNDRNGRIVLKKSVSG